MHRVAPGVSSWRDPPSRGQPPLLLTAAMPNPTAWPTWWSVISYLFQVLSLKRSEHWKPSSLTHEGDSRSTKQRSLEDQMRDTRVAQRQPEGSGFLTPGVVLVAIQVQVTVKRPRRSGGGKGLEGLPVNSGRYHAPLLPSGPAPWGAGDSCTASPTTHTHSHWATFRLISCHQ